MGMLNAGMDIRDFENREKRKQLAISQEAWYAENMANLFLIEYGQGYFNNFNQVSAAAFTAIALNVPAPQHADHEVEAVRSCLGAC